MGIVAIHNKNGKGLLHTTNAITEVMVKMSQSTIKMEKGYYGKHRKEKRFIPLGRNPQ